MDDESFENNESNESKNEVEVVESDTIFCYKCGTKNLSSNKFCQKCGAKLKNEDADESDVIRCPNCGSKNVEFVTYQASSNFDAGDACCGYMLCGPIGLLCGAQDKTPAKTVRKCKKCGHEF